MYRSLALLLGATLLIAGCGQSGNQGFGLQSKKEQLENGAAKGVVVIEPSGYKVNCPAETATDLSLCTKLDQFARYRAEGGKVDQGTKPCPSEIAIRGSVTVLDQKEVVDLNFNCNPIEGRFDSQGLRTAAENVVELRRASGQ